MSDYCCFLPQDKKTPLKEAKNTWDKHEGYFIGIGYIFPRKHEEDLEKVCSKADISLLKLPMNGLSFEEYRDSYKLDFLRTLKIEKESSLLSQMKKRRIESYEELKSSNSSSDLPMKMLLQEIEEIDTNINRRQKAEVVRDSSTPALPIQKATGVPFPSSYTFQDFMIDLSQTKEGLQTGYPSLDEVIEIPQAAITLVAGRPSHGKTITKLNLLLKMVLKHEKMKFYFFSYEESKSQIFLKLLNILGAEIINEQHNLSNIEGYLRGKHRGRSKIDQATQILHSLTESGRLVISDYSYFVDDLSSVIAKLKERDGEQLGAVFIDYIQKVKIRHKYSTRQLELQKISESILETALTCKVAIVLGAQLGRGAGKKEVLQLANLREAGDLENDASLVLGIWNQAKEEADSKDQMLTSRKVDLEIIVLKNRKGPSNQSIFLEFDRPLSTLNEKQKTSSKTFGYND
jgi:replicative DNA helicase